jgi:hypothetical protein
MHKRFNRPIMTLATATSIALLLGACPAKPVYHAATVLYPPQPVQQTAGPACAHSPCVTGVALDPSCADWCVGRIAAVAPSCATSAWVQPCVDMVGTFCNLRCDCSTDCVQGNGFDMTACAVTQRECSRYPSCCTTGWTADCISNAEQTCGLKCP